MILIPELFFQLDEGDRRGHDHKLFKKTFRLKHRLHDTTGCQTGLTTGLTTGCIV